MKITLIRMSLISSCLFVMSTAQAYKFIIYTDEPNPKKAKEVSEMMKTVYPFSKLSIEVEIVKLQPNELDCGSMYGIDRLVGCANSDDIQERVMMANGDQGMVIKDLSQHGGSAQIGGGIPVITTNSDSTTMLHEFMHTLGMCDEYEYPASEAAIFCTDYETPNLVFINPLDPYASDSIARAEHMGQIPWASDINAATPITNTNGTRLGTGDVNFNNLVPINRSASPQNLTEITGLYKGKTCNKAVPIKVSWHPGAGSTIMENTLSGLGLPLERIVERIMISKGAKYKITKLINLAPATNDIVNAQPDPRVNNSSSMKIRRTDNVNTIEIVKPSATSSK